ncbi:hypothetical protein RJT34_12396 [Clitoria ternatea]|uniref:Uncharacterized protein n=1 Tax=Clitoria ternatea TaxID=43366 RepID=A0AAN9JLM4_CLITE
MRPMARMKTESVGYHESGTGLIAKVDLAPLDQWVRSRPEKVPLERELHQSPLLSPFETRDLTKILISPQTLTFSIIIQVIRQGGTDYR